MNLRRTTKTAPALAIRDPFAVVPLQPENVELRRNAEGMIHLRLTPCLKPSYRKIAGWLRYNTTRKIELDAHGSLYYGLVDGQRSLGEIVDAMVSRLGKTRSEIEPMVILFTKNLMTRNLVALRVPGHTATESSR